MSQEDYIEKILGMEDIIIEKVEEERNQKVIQIALRRKECACPQCGNSVRTVHDYRLRTLSDTGIGGKNVRLHYRRRRYQCPLCEKRFSEACSFAGKYQRYTYRIVDEIMKKLQTRRSMKDIAGDTGTSVSAVMRCLSLFPAGKPKALPRVLSFDEFKGNAGGEKFQCILTAPEERKVLDILPNRTVSTLQTYLRSFENRQDVEYIVMDMNRGYRDIARTFFPNARIVIDRFHVSRYCTWAMDDVRRSIQKNLRPETRRHFKRSRRLLLTHRDLLSDEEKAELDRLLRFSETLLQAYALKEAFYDFMASKSSSAAAERLKRWFDAYDRLKIPEFKACYRMLRNWKPYILNAFDVPYSNGFTEGCNNAVKTLKRISFGLKNFHRFRMRILLTANLHPNI